MGSDRPASVLVVDDEPANLALLRAYLDSQYRVEEANNGPDALEILKTHPIDLVLLDVMMPDMNGMDVCRIVKGAATDAAYLPVVLLTALDAQEDRNRGLEAGADDFLTKPVDRHELLLRAQSLIRLRRQDELIRTQLRELRLVDALKDDLVALMVHDIRNPLSGVVGFLDLVQSDAGHVDFRDDARMAFEAGQRLKEILDDILHVRMLESNAVQLHWEPLDAETLVKDAVASIWGAARARQVGISQMVDASALHLTADRKFLRRAIENLLANALKYSPRGEVVQASVRGIGDEIEIEVADRGQGVPEHLRDRLFQKFESVESLQGQSRRGVGLGLYLVRLVAQAHGGRALVKGRQGGGASFTMVLPREHRI
ncbi:MAG: response regulator [Polyangia bacterium]